MQLNHAKLYKYTYAGKAIGQTASPENQFYDKGHASPEGLIKNQ